MDGDRSRPMSSCRTPGSSALGASGTGADRVLPRRPEATVSPTPAGTFRAARCGPLQPGTAHAFGDRIPVPDGVECPRPHKDVPARDNMSPAARSTPARAVGPDHEWGTHTDRPFAVPPATGTPPFPTTTTSRPSAETSGPTPHVRGRRSRRTGPGPVLIVWRRV